MFSNKGKPNESTWENYKYFIILPRQLLVVCLYSLHHQLVSKLALIFFFTKIQFCLKLFVREIKSATFRKHLIYLSVKNENTLYLSIKQRHNLYFSNWSSEPCNCHSKVWVFIRTFYFKEHKCHSFRLLFPHRTPTAMEVGSILQQVNENHLKHWFK